MNVSRTLAGLLRSLRNPARNPGPTVLLVISYALGHGRKVAFATVAGVTLGDFGEPHQNGACDHEGQCVLLAIWKESADVMRRHLDGFTLASIAAVANGEAPWPGIEELARNG